MHMGMIQYEIMANRQFEMEHQRHMLMIQYEMVKRQFEMELQRQMLMIEYEMAKWQYEMEQQRQVEVSEYEMAKSTRGAIVPPASLVARPLAKRQYEMKQQELDVLINIHFDSLKFWTIFSW